MAGVTPALAIFVFLLIIVISIYVAIRVNPITFDDSRTRVFLVTLVSLAIVMTVLFYYGTLQVQQVQQRANVLTQTTTLGNDVLNAVINDIVMYVAYIPDFALSLLPLRPACDALFNNGKSCCNGLEKSKTPGTVLRNQDPSASLVGTRSVKRSKKPKRKEKKKGCVHKAAEKTAHKVRLHAEPLAAPALDPCTPEAIVRREALSFRVFTVWQEVILYGDLIDITPLAYVTNFLQRAHSRLLYENWQYMKIDFNKQTQEFGDLLFCYGLNVEPQTPEAYVCAAKRLLASRECQNMRLKL